MWDMSVILHQEAHLVSCLLSAAIVAICLVLHLAECNNPYVRNSCMYFQCHNYFNFFCASVLSDQAEKCRGSHFKKSLCHSSSDPTVSSYVSNLSYTFERTDRNNLCLANQDCLCHAFIFSPKLCRVQLAV